MIFNQLFDQQDTKSECPEFLSNYNQLTISSYMKNFLIKTKLIAFAIIAFISISTNAQELTPTLPIEEIQEMMLIEHKISFNSQQMDLNSIKISAIDDTEKTIDPTLTISPEQTFITIDFSKCESGDYLIVGKNGDETIKFLVKHIK